MPNELTLVFVLRRDVAPLAGSLSHFLYAVVCHAFWAANPAREDAHFAINALTDPLGDVGNGTCVNVCRVQRSDDLRATAAAITEQSNSLANVLVFDARSVRNDVFSSHHLRIWSLNNEREMLRSSSLDARRGMTRVAYGYCL